jgi:hypothetical protein
MAMTQFHKGLQNTNKKATAKELAAAFYKLTVTV